MNRKKGERWYGVGEGVFEEWDQNTKRDPYQRKSLGRRMDGGGGRRCCGAHVAVLLLAFAQAAHGAAHAAAGGGLPLGQEAPIAPTLSTGNGVGGSVAYAQPMHMHTMWGGAEWVDQGNSKFVPVGMKLKVTPDELDAAYGLKPNPAITGLENDMAAGNKLAHDYWEQNVAHMGTGGDAERGRHMPTKVAQAKHADHKQVAEEVEEPLAKLPGNQESRRIKAGAGSRAARGQVLSPIGQEEQGVNPRGQPCPNWGLDSVEFQVVGFAAHSWRKTVQIRSVEGDVLGTIKRGCPAWTNSFVWMVPDEHASGCRDNVDPNVFSSKCQMPEVEILYTVEFSGLLNPNGIKIIDCHDDQIFSLHEEHREIIIHDFKIESSFLVKDLNGNTMGYCRQDKSGRGLAHVGDHNFTIVDLEGEIVATATRPLHWANGATEHVWDVKILQESVPLTLSDMRVVATAVVNNVLLHEIEDWCSDIVFALTPILITLVAIGIIAAISTCMSWFKPDKIKP